MDGIFGLAVALDDRGLAHRHALPRGAIRRTPAVSPECFNKALTTGWSDDSTCNSGAAEGPQSYDSAVRSLEPVMLIASALRADQSGRSTIS